MWFISAFSFSRCYKRSLTDDKVSAIMSSLISNSLISVQEPGSSWHSLRLFKLLISVHPYVLYGPVFDCLIHHFQHSHISITVQYLAVSWLISVKPHTLYGPIFCCSIHYFHCNTIFLTESYLFVYFINFGTIAMFFISLYAVILNSSMASTYGVKDETDCCVTLQWMLDMWRMSQWQLPLLQRRWRWQDHRDISGWGLGRVLHGASWPGAQIAQQHLTPARYKQAATQAASGSFHSVF